MNPKTFARLLFIIGVVASLIAPFAGAHNAYAQGDLYAGVSNKYAGTELRLIVANHPWSVAIQKLIPDFEKASGMSLRIENYFEDQLSQKLQIGFTSGTTSVDVVMFRPLQEGKLFAKNGWLADVSAQVQSDDKWSWQDFQEGPRGTVTLDKTVFGVPLVTEREMIYYRKDLFDQKNIKVPTTMDELMAAAKALNDPANGFYGIVMRGQRSPAVTQFSSFLYSFGGTWIKDGKSAVNTPEAIAAYKFYGDLLRNYGPQGTLNMSWPQAVAIFQQGKAAMWIDADSLYTNAVDPTKSTVADKVGYAAFPAGPAGAKPYNITSWALGMNKNSKNLDAAWEFVKWATSAPVVMNFQQGGLPGARASVWNAPDGLKGFPAPYAEVVKLQSKTGVGLDRPLVVKVAQARDIVGNPIVVSIQGGDVEKAAAEADTAFNAFLAEDMK